MRGDRILNRLSIGLTSFVTLVACAGLAMLLYAAKRSGCILPPSLAESGSAPSLRSSLSWWPIARQCTWTLSGGKAVITVDTSLYAQTAIVYGLCVAAVSCLVMVAIDRRSHNVRARRLHFWSAFGSAIVVVLLGATLSTQAIRSVADSPCDRPYAPGDSREMLIDSQPQRSWSLWPLERRCVWALTDGTTVDDVDASKSTAATFSYLLVLAGTGAAVLAVSARVALHRRESFE